MTIADADAGRLSPSRASRIEAHVLGCPRCQVTQRAVGRAGAAIHDASQVVPSHAAQNGSIARLEALLRWSRIDGLETVRAPRVRGPFIAGLAFSSTLAAGLVVGLQVLPTPDPVAVATPRARVAVAAAPIAPTAPVVAAAVDAPAQVAMDPAPSGPVEAVVTLTSGDVRVGRGEGGEWHAAYGEIAEDDRLRVGSGARVALQWGEGSGALIESNSAVRVRRLRPREQVLDLDRGRVAVRVGKHQPGEVMQVVSGDHVVTVHGTWFVVTRERNGTTVEVLEGVVEIASRNGTDPPTRLPASMRAFFPTGRSLPARDQELSTRDATILRIANEMALLPWSGDRGQMLDGTGLLEVAPRPSAEASVDGVPLGRTPLFVRRPLGRHLVEVGRPGLTPQRKWVELGDAPARVTPRMPPDPAVVTAGDEAQALFKARRVHVSGCYDHALKRDPDLKGRVSLAIEIGADGHVQSARPRRDTLRDAQVVNCLVSEVEGWVFERTRSAKVLYPFVFRAE